MVQLPKICKEQLSGDQLDDQLENENITTPTFGNDNLNSSSSSNEANSQQKEEPLLVEIRDTLTGEVTTQKMQADRVWNLEKNKKIVVELNGDGQGSDNGSNLLVRFLGKLSQKSIICPISVERWDRMPEAKNRLQWQLVETQSEQNARNRSKLKVPHAGGSKSNARRGRQMDKISEHLSQDQEHACHFRCSIEDIGSS
ncbi:uncharacterized protein LOC132050327 isoform X3 [Lycium ferocissimum]|uniref:uncharacterized protein LOC132050327 isoform X3 n=1 Tax=Lycium ferocissimum TaxID=112874 RepID=UPI0028150820|nr:uncharacterized protein LOC132050327 isoform X3 [Lycium ferocissimum]